MRKMFRRYTMADGIRAVLALLLGVVPLSFSTMGPQLLEATTVMVSYGLVLLMMLFIIIDIARRQTCSLRFSLCDGFVGVGIGVALLASLFGVDLYHSLAGYQLIMTMSWMSILALAVVYYVIRLYVTERHQAMMLLTAAAFGLTIMSIVQVVGRFIQLPFVMFSASFNMIGLGAALASSMWGIIMLVSERVWFKRLSSIAWVLTTVTVIALNNIVGLLATVIVTFCAILALSSQATVLRKGFMWLMTGYMGIMTLVIVFPVMSSIGIPRTIDIALPLSQTVNVVGDVLRHDLMLGVGPQNFTYALHAYKPQALNLSPAWNIEFTRAGSTAFELLATFGVLGAGVVLGAVVVFIIRGVMLIRATRVSTTLYGLKGVVLNVGIVSIGITLIALAVLTYLEWYALVWMVILFALVVQMTETQRRIEKRISMPLVHATVYVGIVVVLIGGYYGGRWHAGSGYVYKQYASAEDARVDLEKALTLNRRQAETWIMHANVVMSELTTTDDLRVAQRLHETILADYAKGIEYAGNRAYVYALLRESMLAYMQQGGVLSTELETVTQRLKELDPNNPKLFLEEGLRYQAYAQYLTQRGQGDSQELLTLAEDQFMRALELKPNYSQAYYALGNFYETTQGAYDQAEQQYLRALVIDPLNKETLLALLDVMVYHTDKVDDALMLLERYLQDNPDDSTLLLHQEEYLLATQRDATAVTQRIEELGIERP